MDRPWVWVAAGLAGGLYAAAMGGYAWPVAGLAGLAALGIAASARGRSGLRDRVLVLWLFTAVGAALWFAREPRPQQDALYHHAIEHADAEHWIEGVVRESFLCLPGIEYGSLVIDTDRYECGAEVFPAQGGVVARWNDPAFPVHPGERVRVRGTITAYLGPVNFNVSGFEERWRRQGVFTALNADDESVERLATPRFRLDYWASRFRQWQAEAFLRTIPGSARPYVWAVWLGDRGLLRQDLNDAFIASGTAHILSVSGVHMAVVYLSLDFLLFVFVRPPRARALIIIPAIFMFALVSGGREASFRSALMISLYLLAEVFEREPDAPTALSISAVLLLAIDPGDLFDAGFLLSYASIASILLFQEPIQERCARLPGLLRADLSTALAVQILPLPLAARYFHLLPLLGVAANLVVIPLTTATLWVCALTVACTLFLPIAAPIFGHALVPIAWLVERTVQWAGAPAVAHPVLLAPSPVAVGLYFTGALALYFALAREMAPVPGAYAALPPRRNRVWDYLRGLSARQRWQWAASFAFLAALECWTQHAPRACVDVLDVGHADAIVVHTPAGGDVLIDGGRPGDGKRAVLPYLLANGIRTLDAVVNTHPDDDHIGGLLPVLKTISADRLFIATPLTPTASETELLSRCAQRGIPVQALAAGQRFEAGGALFEVLHPPGDWSQGNDNNRSLTLRVSWPGFSMLLAGDIEREAEWTIARSDCRALVLKVPHHGSATSSTPQWIDAVSPALALVSTGPFRKEGRTGPGVLERYAQRKIPCWRTDYAGGLRVWGDAEGLKVTGARRVQGYSLAPEP